MRMRFLSTLVVLTLAAAFGEASDDWSRWRGPHMNGVADTATPPLTWSETENVVWKLPLPGHGSSTPILWKDRLYVLTAERVDGVDAPVPPHRQGPDRPPSESAQRFRVLALDRATGATVWERTAN